MDGVPLTEGGIIGHADGTPGLMAFRVNGHVIPLSVHYPNGVAVPIACWRCGDTRSFEGARCPSCRPAPPPPTFD